MTDPSSQAKPRSIEEVFNDLKSLAQSDGSLHSISKIIKRDWFLTVDMQEGALVGDADKRWSLSKLNNNEILLLLGLMVQSPSDRIFSVLPVSDDFIDRADKLLREFHDAVMAEVRIDRASRIGVIAREALYYGADTFYMSQFEKYAKYRYKNDGEWLLRNAGISVLPMLSIARFMADCVNLQMTIVLNGGPMGQVDGFPTLDRDLDYGTITGMMVIPKGVLRKKFGQKIDAFLKKFSTKAFGENAGFVSPFAVNQVNLSPLIDLGEHIFVPNQYRLFAAIYESPFYWTMADASYRDTASRHRGDFVEKCASSILRRIFGDEHVHDNVVIMDGKDIAAEADVLVAYGEFLIVVQAKSKRITLKARAGDEDALKADFKGAIQDPYQQAYKFGKLAELGQKCIGRDGKEISLPDIKRVFPVVLLSDGFPGMTFLSRGMLERHPGVAPVIWDLGTMDTISQILPTALDFLYFLKCRSDTFDAILSDSEYNYLGYHLKLKLVRPADADFMDIGRDFATEVDDFMVATEAGAKAERPIGVLDRIQLPLFTELFKDLKSAPPHLAAIIIDLYDFSSEALRSYGEQILEARNEVVQGKAFKSISIPTQSGGITYVISRDRDPRTLAAARAIGHKYKYDTKSDRWYVIVNVIDTDRAVDMVLPILEKWSEDSELAENSKFVRNAFSLKPKPPMDPAKG
jgi:hypothetical protein